MHKFYYSPFIREQRPEFYLKILFISQSFPSTCLPIQSQFYHFVVYRVNSWFMCRQSGVLTSSRSLEF